MVSRILVDADACPVRDEALRVAERHGAALVLVSNGGLRSPGHPLVQMVYVPEGPDMADRWIADQAGPRDVVITADVPLAARAVAAGARVMGPDGTLFTSANIGARLASRDLMADLRAAEPLRAGGAGRAFSRGDRSRFLQALDAALVAIARAEGAP